MKIKVVVSETLLSVVRSYHFAVVFNLDYAECIRQNIKETWIKLQTCKLCRY